MIQTIPATEWVHEYRFRWVVVERITIRLYPNTSNILVSVDWPDGSVQYLGPFTVGELKHLTGDPY
ncbi:MAG TPA: hypothetical protein VGM27_11470 [Acidobacteriaceae bacterium]